MTWPTGDCDLSVVPSLCPYFSTLSFLLLLNGRLSSYQSFLDILNEMNDYAGQRELIAENMMMNICIDLTKYLQELKQERKTVSFMWSGPGVHCMWLKYIFAAASIPNKLNLACFYRWNSFCKMFETRKFAHTGSLKCNFPAKHIFPSPYCLLSNTPSYVACQLCCNGFLGHLCTF